MSELPANSINQHMALRNGGTVVITVPPFSQIPIFFLYEVSCMLFSSTVFLFWFLPLTLALYYLCACLPCKIRIYAKNAVLLLASLYFYAFGERYFVRIMLASIVCNYLFGRFIGYFGKNGKQKPCAAKAVLITALVCNLGLLFVYKYLTFTLSNIDRLLPLPFAIPQIALPIGISFFTFQSMSYIIDVYRGDAGVQKNPFDLALYVSLFPQLIAGPIVRYQTVADQIKNRMETWNTFSHGLCRFLCGLFKKVLLSNQMGMAADKAFSMNADGTLSTAMAWLGALSYALQIYYDFSGYSDMAIGLGKMFGFRFLENFCYPYISQSITEFWRRWHISLGTWFREYVYIPLGGNRGGKWKMYRNLFAVWFLTGFWHGANWNFILWGLYYFVLLVVEKTFLLEKMKSWPAAFRHIYTLFFVYFGWMIFYFENMNEGAAYLGTMFGVGAAGLISMADLYAILHRLVFVAILVVASIPQPRRLFYKLYENHRAARYAAAVGGICVVVLATAYLVDSSFNPFLYFRF